MAFRFTPTPTASITPTLSLTASVTPTKTPTSTVCPGLTPTATPTLPVSPTPTNTATKTLTPTPTTTPCIDCYVYYFTASTSGLLSWLDCDGILSDTFVNSGDTYTINCIGAREGTVTGTGTIVKGALCSSNCITPSVTPTNTLTPSNTPTTSIEATPTLTPTPTQSEGFVCETTTYLFRNDTEIAIVWTGQDCFGEEVFNVIQPGELGGTPCIKNGTISYSPLTLVYSAAC